MRRVCIVTTGHPPYDDRVFFKEARALKRAGFDVRIVCSTGRFDETRDGIRVLGFGTDPFLSTSLAFRMFKLARLAIIVYRQRCHIYHCHEFGALLSCHLARFLGLLFQRRGAFIIYDVHEWFPWSFSWESGNSFLKSIRGLCYRRIFSFVCNRTDHIILNEEIKMPLFTEVLTHQRLTTVENFPPLDLFHSSQKQFDRGHFVIGYAGVLSIEHGTHRLARATQIFSQRHKTKPILLLVGDFRSVEEKAGFLRSIDDTSFDLQITGWVTHKRVPQLMADADVCLLPLQPSERTIRCTPVKLYEYMALSKPVIASNFGEIKRIVEKTGSGLLVDASDPGSLADALSSYYTNPAEMARHGALARQWSEREFNWKACEHRLLHVYSTPSSQHLSRNTNRNKKYS